MSNAFDFGTGNIAVALDVLFPTNVNPGPGVGIDKTGGVWTVSLDTPPLAENISPAPTSNYFVAIYDNEQGLYEKVRLDNLVAAATASLDVRTPIGDANYTVLSSDRYVGLTAQLTVNRTLSLPPANTAAGRELTLQDEVGGLSGAHYWIIGTTGTDTINGQHSGLVLATAYGGVKLRSNGTNAWNIIARSGATVLQDTSYTANGDEHVILMATLTVPRSVTLPPAAQYSPGNRLLIVDQSGSCSSTNTITITPHAGDLINGVGSAVLQQAYDFRGLISDAVSKWTIVDTSQGAGGGGGGPVHSTDIVDSSPLGRALITQTTAAQDRTSLGSGLTGDQVFLAASPGAARVTLGSGAVGDQVFQAATTGAAQTALGLASGATMPATTVGATPPATPLVGQQWWDTNGGQLYVWYNDGTSSQWVPASNLNVAGIYLPLTGGALSGPLTAQAVSMTSLNGGQLAGLRNLIINGDMRIDQRNGGAGGTAPSVYTVDRWYFGASATGKGTWQGTSGGPPGFSNQLFFTSSSAYAITASDNFDFIYTIEATDFTKSQWGTAGALPAILSFWAYASIAGTYGGAFKNTGTAAAATRSYPFSYTLPANAWTYVTIPVPGDTTGTWALSGNGAGLGISFGMGVGATYSAPAGAWTAGNFLSSNGAVSVVGTNGASFHITGVQFEFGSVATPFERRPIGSELALCQRYYQRYTSSSVGGITVGGYSVALGGIGSSVPFPQMRATPVSAIIGTWTGSNLSGTVSVAVNAPNIAYISIIAAAQGAAYVQNPANGGFDLSAEL